MMDNDSCSHSTLLGRQSLVKQVRQYAEDAVLEVEKLKNTMILSKNWGQKKNIRR